MGEVRSELNPKEQDQNETEGIMCEESSNNSGGSLRTKWAQMRKDKSEPDDRIARKHL